MTIVEQMERISFRTMQMKMFRVKLDVLIVKAIILRAMNEEERQQRQQH